MRKPNRASRRLSAWPPVGRYNPATLTAGDSNILESSVGLATTDADDFYDADDLIHKNVLSLWGVSIRDAKDHPFRVTPALLEVDLRPLIGPANGTDASSGARHFLPLVLTLQLGPQRPWGLPDPHR